MADEDRYYDEDGPAFAEHQRQRAEAESPHEYVGMDTDIGVGVEWEPVPVTLPDSGKRGWGFTTATRQPVGQTVW